MYDFFIVASILVLIASYSLNNEFLLNKSSHIIFVLLLIYSIYNNISYHYLLIYFVFIVISNNGFKKIKDKIIDTDNTIINKIYDSFITLFGLNNNNYNDLTYDEYKKYRKKNKNKKQKDICDNVSLNEISNNCECNMCNFESEKENNINNKNYDNQEEEEYYDNQEVKDYDENDLNDDIRAEFDLEEVNNFYNKIIEQEQEQEQEQDQEQNYEYTEYNKVNEKDINNYDYKDIDIEKLKNMNMKE